jgi:hypothetical protein
LHANPTRTQAQIDDALTLFHLLTRALRFVVLFFAVPVVVEADFAVVLRPVAAFVVPE